MSQKEREAAITRMRQGESWIMISTEVMARGLDFKGVQGVINFDFPPSVQSYVHRIGRFYIWFDSYVTNLNSRYQVELGVQEERELQLHTSQMKMHLS